MAILLLAHGAQESINVKNNVSMYFGSDIIDMFITFSFIFFCEFIKQYASMVDDLKERMLVFLKVNFIEYVDKRYSAALSL